MFTLHEVREGWVSTNIVKRLVIAGWQMKAEQGLVKCEGIAQVFGEPVGVCGVCFAGSLSLVLLVLIWSVVASATVVVVESRARAWAGVRSSWGSSESVFVGRNSGGS